VSWLVGAGVSLELMIRTAARKLPASNLLDTAAASLLLSFDFLLVLLSVVCEWTVGTASLSHAAVRLLIMLLKFLFDPPLIIIIITIILSLVAYYYYQRNCVLLHCTNVMHNRSNFSINNYVPRIACNTRRPRENLVGSTQHVNSHRPCPRSKGSRHLARREENNRGLV